MTNPYTAFDDYGLRYLPGHLIDAQMWDDLERVLTDLYFIEAKCAVGLIYDLVVDYDLALQAIPDLAWQKQDEQDHQSQIQNYAQAMLAYARGELAAPPFIASARPWDQKKITQYAQRLALNPTPYERVQAFAHFVKAESHGLMKFGNLPGFCFQQAINYSRAGVVSSAAETLMDASDPGLLLLRNRSSRPALLSMPAMLMTLEGHTAKVTNVCITPDGKQAVSGGWDKLCVWDLKSGRCLRTLSATVYRPYCMMLTADGKTVVVADRSDLSVWDVESGTCQRNVETSPEGPSAMSITADGSRALTGHESGLLCAWDLEKGLRYQTYPGHTGRVLCLAISPNGKRAISGSQDGTLRLWDLEKGQSITITLIDKTAGGVQGVSMTPDGKKAVVAGGLDRALYVWDLKTNQCRNILPGHTNPIRYVTVTPDGRTAISTGGNNENGTRILLSDYTVRMWDTLTGQCLNAFTGHRDGVNCASVTPDGRVAVSGSDDKTLRVWNLINGQCGLSEESRSRSCRAVSLTSDGTKIISSSDDDNKTMTGGGNAHTPKDAHVLHLWDPKTGACEATLRGYSDNSLDDITGVTFTPDNRQVISQCGRGLRLWDLQKGRCLRQVKGGWLSGSNFVEFTPDGQRAISKRGGRLSFWDVGSGIEIHRIKDHDNCIVRFTPDGWRALSGGGDALIRIYDLESDRVVGRFDRHVDPIVGLGLTPDGCVAVSSSGSLHHKSGPTLLAWQISDGRCLRLETRVGFGFITLMAITPDGRKVVTGSDWQFAGDEIALQVWDLQTGQCTTTLSGHQDRVTCLRITPDGRRAITGGDDRTARLWDLEQGRCLAAIQAKSSVQALPEVRGNGYYALGTSSDDVILLTPRHLFEGIPWVTATRLWLYGRPSRILSRLVGKREKPGQWEKTIGANCYWCGQRFPVPMRILSIIEWVARTARLQPDESPCLILSSATWQLPGLVSECPLCRRPLRYNPFVVDNREKH